MTSLYFLAAVVKVPFGEDAVNSFDSKVLAWSNDEAQSEKRTLREVTERVLSEYVEN